MQPLPEQVRTQIKSEQTHRDIPQIYPMITKDEMCKTINEMIRRINFLEGKLADRTRQTKEPETKTPKKFLPVLNIDSEGAQDLNTGDRTDDIPLDFTLVKHARKNKEQRPELPQHIKKVVTKEIKEHIKEQKNKEIKTKPQEEMQDSTKQEKVKEMLNRQ